MERKNFINTCACGLMGIAGISAVANPAQNEILNNTEGKSEAGTPCAEKHAFAQKYVKRLMDICSEKLDQQTRIDLVQTMGATCAKEAYTEKASTIKKVTVDEFVSNLGGRKEGNTIYWEYIGSPWTGLKVADGYCLCPLTEKGPEGLSGLWCECSIGYVKYMFEFFTDQKYNVELLESLKRGGKGCRFKITHL